MTIGHDGRVGINDTSPSYTLDVNGDGRFINKLYVNDTFYAKNTTIYSTNVEVNSLGSGDRYAYVDLHGDDTYTDYGLRIIRLNNGANTDSEIIHRGTGDLKLKCPDGGSVLIETDVNVDGDIIAKGEVESYDTSDIRFKDQVEDLNPVWITEDLMNLRTIRYRHKLKNKIELGLIAQEVQACFPENVKENGNGMLMIHYGKMIAPLLAMTQQQEKRIIELERQFARY